MANNFSNVFPAPQILRHWLAVGVTALLAGSIAWAQGQSAASTAEAQPHAAQQDDIPRPVAPDPVLEDRVMALSHQLRCLVCQNQSIAESNAPLAVDLREQVRQQMRAGRSEREITSYMVQRYGDFVLYTPPLKRSTMLLWLGPGALFLIGIAMLVIILRRRTLRESAPRLSAADRARAQALLAEDAPLPSHDTPQASAPQPETTPKAALKP